MNIRFHGTCRADVLSKQWMKCQDVSTISRLPSKHLPNLRTTSLNEGRVFLLSQKVHYTPLVCLASGIELNMLIETQLSRSL
jgi:hypothetical protein